MMLQNFGFGDFIFKDREGPEADRGRRPQDPGGEAGLGAPGVDHPSRRAQPLLELAEGAHRVRSRPRAASAAGDRLRERRGAAGEPHPARSGATAWSRARPSWPTSIARTFDVSGDFYPHRRRLARAARPAAWPSSGGARRARAAPTASRASRSRCRRAVVLGTDVFDEFLEQNDLELRDRVRRRRRDRSGASSPPAFPRTSERRPARLPREGRLAPGRALLEPARGLASTSPSPASTRPHAAQQRPEPRRAPRASCCVAIKRVYASTFSQHAKALPPGHPVPPGGGEDGGAPPEDRGLRHGAAASTPTSPAWRRSHNFYPTPPAEVGGRDRGRGPGPGPDRRRRRRPACASARSTRGTSCSSPRWPRPSRRPRRSSTRWTCRRRGSANGGMREEVYDLCRRRGGRRPRRGRVDLLAGERRRLRRHLTPRVPGSSPSLRSSSTDASRWPRSSGRSWTPGSRGWASRWRSSSRSTSPAGAASGASSASSSCGPCSLTRRSEALELDEVESGRHPVPEPTGARATAASRVSATSSSWTTSASSGRRARRRRPRWAG